MSPHSLRGRRVAVYGAGRSGLAAVRLCLREGATPLLLDDRPEPSGTTSADASAPVALFSGFSALSAERQTEILCAQSLLVVSPGVPLASPSVALAQALGVEVMGEVELASRFLPSEGVKIGITGTNGKSTTTALCGELFQRAGKKTFVGGNLGQPLCEAALQGPFEAYVIELSSFQLEGVETLRLHAAAILNLAPDHLDRYPSSQAYAAAKARIFAAQTRQDVAVLNADDAAVMALAKIAPGTCEAFSLISPPRQGAFGQGSGFRTFPEDGEFQLRNRALRGAHNLQNAMAAALLALRSGISADAIQDGLDSFPGLAHRLESVATSNGVEWINDSKATNVDSTRMALNALPGPLWLIAGGKGKGAPYTPLVEAARGKVKGVLTVGQDSPALEQAFGGMVPVYPCGTLGAAVSQASRLAKPGDTVLLSPACASYDQFRNFEDRGEAFKSMVKAIS